MKISLEQFVNETKGTAVDVPWESDGHLKGQCVSLVQQYLVRCLEQEAKPRGNAKDWINTYVAEGLGNITNELRKGDLLVFPNEANGYGHIAIYVNESATYDQNNLRHDNGLAGYGTIFSNDYVALRPNAELIEDAPIEVPSEPTTTLEVGTRVRTIGAGNGSSYGDSNSAASGLEGTISRIEEGREYPYCVDDDEGPLGWYKAEDLEII